MVLHKNLALLSLDFLLHFFVCTQCWYIYAADLWLACSNFLLIFLYVSRQVQLVLGHVQYSIMKEQDIHIPMDTKENFFPQELCHQNSLTSGMRYVQNNIVQY